MRTIFLVATILVIVVVTITILPREEQQPPAHIGGAFDLTNQHGENFTSNALEGRYSLVFFGFTHCPAICPTALLTISNSMQAMGDKAKNITPVFITVDPERDTVQRMQEYMADFYPGMIALTGTKQQINQVEQAYKVYSQRREDASEAAGYTMDHSGFIYLMDKQGNYLTHFPYNVSQDDLIKGITKHMKP